MPYEDFIYYGDSKHAPYGTKSLEEVRSLTISHTRELMGQGAKAVAIACNTATSAAVRILRQMYPQLPLVGIEPARNRRYSSNIIPLYWSWRHP